MCRDSRIVPGAAATEIELAKRVKEFSYKETGYFTNVSLLISFKIFNCTNMNNFGKNEENRTSENEIMYHTNAHVICVLYEHHVL